MSAPPFASLSVYTKYYEKYAVVAVTSIYGVDLLQDNVSECQERLFQIFDKECTENCKSEISDECRQAVRFILRRNILCGDTLTLKAIEGEPIIFSDRSLVSDSMMQRRDFRFDEMFDGHQEQMLIFMGDWEYDQKIQAFMPKPSREFPLIYYSRMQQYE